MGQTGRAGCSAASFAWLRYDTDFGDPGVVVSGGGSAIVPWYSFKTTDPACFYTSVVGEVVSNTPGDTTLVLRKPGVYHVHIRANWGNVAFSRFLNVNNGLDVQDISGLSIESSTLPLPASEDADTSLFIQGYAGGNVQFANGVSYVGYLQAVVSQFSGGNHTLRRAYMTVEYSSTGSLATVYGS